jgi:hypothetical protein
MTTLNCQITVKGRYGRSKDLTKPIRDFLVDDMYYYTAVLKHLRRCTICDPLECLQIYLERRRTNPKFSGETSNGLIELAFKYDRLLRRRGHGQKVPQEILAEFIWRSASCHALLNYQGKLTLLQKARAIQLILKDPKRLAHNLQDLCNKSEEYRTIYNIVANTNNPPETEQELQRLMVIAEVMIS